MARIKLKLRGKTDWVNSNLGSHDDYEKLRKGIDSGAIEDYEFLPDESSINNVP